MNPAPAERFGVYLHVPICLAVCSYCDFPVRGLKAFGAENRRALVPLLERELGLWLAEYPALAGRAIDSIYFGGGTPSLLEPEEIDRLLRLLREAFTPRGDVEVTLECNPMDGEVARLGAFREAGVNRISLGVQSFSRSVLRALGRPNRPEGAAPAIARIRELDFPSWNLDLIFGAPDTGLPDFLIDLEKAIGCEPPHLSLYGLTLHEGTPLHARRESLRLPREETHCEMYLAARRRLRARGWRHYEISNFARPGHESRHNSLYWTGGQYLGLGMGAHSLLEGRRLANPDRFGFYREALEAGRLAARAEEPPAPRAARAERIMLGLRRAEGFDLGEMGRALGCDFLEEYRQEVAGLEVCGWVERAAGRLRLTEAGLLVSDAVFERFF